MDRNLRYGLLYRKDGVTPSAPHTLVFPTRLSKKKTIHNYAIEIIVLLTPIIVSSSPQSKFLSLTLILNRILLFHSPPVLGFMLYFTM